MPMELLRRTFTVDEYHRMAEAGILGEDDPVELLEGTIVVMSPIGVPHAYCVGRLSNLLFARAGDRAMVWVQNPIRLDDRSEPEPDVALLRPPAERYRTAHPGPEDVFLVVEVADTSLHVDRSIKLPLYARYGIPELWLVDLEAERVEVYRQPRSTGYASRHVAGRGEQVSVEALPDARVRVDEILP